MIRAKKVILAQGLIERPLTIKGNDLPGVMLSASVRGYVNKFGVIPGHNVVIFTNNDDAYRTAVTLFKAGANIKFIVDLRKEISGEMQKKVEKLGIKILFNHVLTRFSFCDLKLV